MAVTFRSASSTQGTSTGNTTATEPASAASGDALVAVVLADAASTIGLPAGWTPLYSGTQSAVDWIVGYLIRGGSAPSLVFTFTGTSIYREVQIVALQTSGGTITLDSQSATGTTGNGADAPDPPSTTAVATTSLALCGGINFAGFTTIAAPSGYTLRGDVTPNTYDAGIGTKALSAAGAENPAAFGGSWNGGDWWNGFTLTFTDAAGGGGSIVPVLLRQYRARWS